VRQEEADELGRYALIYSKCLQKLSSVACSVNKICQHPVHYSQILSPVSIGKPSFFNTRVIWANLYSDGKEPMLIEMLKRFAIIGDIIF